MEEDRATFHKEVVDHPDFDAALSDEGIAIDRRKGKTGNSFVKRRPVASLDDKTPF
jgi:hypothetical protein